MVARVLVTRPIAQNKGLVEALKTCGFEPVIFPLLAIKSFQPQHADTYPLIRSQVLRLSEFDFVIFISTNAAFIACDWFDQYWPQMPQQLWLAIGKATANALEAQNLLGMPKILKNTTAMNSESLLSLDQLQAEQVKNKRVLIVRGVGGRETLKDTLQARGADVEYLQVYQRESVEHPLGSLKELLDEGLQVLTASSLQTLDSLLDLAIIESLQSQLFALPLVVPSRRLKTLALDRGFLTVLCAENAGVDAMLGATQKILLN